MSGQLTAILLQVLSSLSLSSEAATVVASLFFLRVGTLLGLKLLSHVLGLCRAVVASFAGVLFPPWSLCDYKSVSVPLRLNNVGLEPVSLAEKRVDRDINASCGI